MNNFLSTLLDIGMFEGFLGAIFFVLYGQITVRRLRKNPATRDYLGLVWDSGGDITSTALVLTMPGYFSKRLKRSRFASLVPNPDVLCEHTTALDRFLAKSLVFLWGKSVSIILFFVVLDALGVPWRVN